MFRGMRQMAKGTLAISGRSMSQLGNRHQIPAVMAFRACIGQTPGLDQFLTLTGVRVVAITATAFSKGIVDNQLGACRIGKFIVTIRTEGCLIRNWLIVFMAG